MATTLLWNFAIQTDRRSLERQVSPCLPLCVFYNGTPSSIRTPSAGKASRSSNRKAATRQPTRRSVIHPFCSGRHFENPPANRCRATRHHSDPRNRRRRPNPHPLMPVIPIRNFRMRFCRPPSQSPPHLLVKPLLAAVISHTRHKPIHVVRKILPNFCR